MFASQIVFGSLFWTFVTAIPCSELEECAAKTCGVATGFIVALAVLTVLTCCCCGLILFDTTRYEEDEQKPRKSRPIEEEEEEDDPLLF